MGVRPLPPPSISYGLGALDVIFTFDSISGVKSRVFIIYSQMSLLKRSLL